jgi:aminopeptidase-like protein
MNIENRKLMIDMDAIGDEMLQLIKELYPLCRSITGNGVRESLRILQKKIPITIQEVSTGTKVFDWTIPKEWNIRDAYIKNSRGEKIVDFKNSNLHVLNYSIPVHKTVSLKELQEHLFSIPEHPDWIPYRTSYYKDNWGFCLTHTEYQSLQEGEYEVLIDSTLENGHLTFGEFFIGGETEDEILLSTHICHPSLCNDNLSGIALTTLLAKYLQSRNTRFSYRFLFIPGTIGSIAWLAQNEQQASRIHHGLVVACVGDSGKPTYKKSRRGDAEIDRAVVHVLKHGGRDFEVRDFSPYGYDERQYCSPGFNLAVGSLTRTPHGCYPEYHTSADNLNFITPEALTESFQYYLDVLEILEHNRCYVNLNPKCEPQLGKRGLYSTMGGRTDAKITEMALLWTLNLSDGTAGLLDIAERSGMKFSQIAEAAGLLFEHGLLAYSEKSSDV